GLSFFPRIRAFASARGSLAAMAAPVSKDQELELHVDSLAFGGNGVARLNGFVVFVRRGLPGDTVRARVTKVKRSHAEALAVEVVEPSPSRVDAPCAHYPACGGCRFQDLAYDVQLEAKHEQVRDALRRIGGIADPSLETIVPAESEFFYRNKLEYSFTASPRCAPSTGQSTRRPRRSPTCRRPSSGATTRSRRSSAAFASASARARSCRPTPRWRNGSTRSPPTTPS